MFVSVFFNFICVSLFYVSILKWIQTCWTFHRTALRLNWREKFNLNNYCNRKSVKNIESQRHIWTHPIPKDTAEIRILLFFRVFYHRVFGYQFYWVLFFLCRIRFSAYNSLAMDYYSNRLINLGFRVWCVTKWFFSPEHYYQTCQANSNLGRSSLAIRCRHQLYIYTLTHTHAHI